MGQTRVMIAAALVAALPTFGMAECVLPEAPGQVTIDWPEAPAVFDLAQRPETPACLQGLESPNQQNCSNEEIAAYSEAIDAYGAALKAHVAAVNAYADRAVASANAAIDAANDANALADATIAFANCEADAINARTE